MYVCVCVCAYVCLNINLTFLPGQSYQLESIDRKQKILQE